MTIVLSALLGAGVTAGTAWFRQHYGARMAARLIYAELTRNSAPIIYYREMHAWSANPVTDTAWNTYGKDLARGREADEFDTVYRGYSAFPALAYVQEHADIAGRDELFDREVEHVIRALHAVGRRARIREEKIAERITRMQPNEAGQSNGVPLAASLMPPALLESVAAYGTKPQQSSAQSTIAVSTQPGGLHRVVLTAHGTEDLDAATVVRREGEVPSGDAAVDEVYDAMGATARFYSDVYGGELESPGSALTAVVHFGEAFLNCFWDGTRVVAGDGDDQIFSRLTSLDVIARELSHGVFARTGLQYAGQSGSVLESLFDVFGVMCKQYDRGQKDAASADWLLGSEIMLKGQALRSLAAPGTAYDDPVIGHDQQPAHMDHYVEGAASNVNSGIGNRAFYLAATAVPGPAWETAGWCWIGAAMGGRLRPKSGFSAFAGLTVAYAKEHWGEDSPVPGAVRTAWHEVGVKPRSPARPKATAETAA